MNVCLCIIFLDFLNTLLFYCSMDRVKRGKWAHQNQVFTCTASIYISFDFGDIKKLAVQTLSRKYFSIDLCFQFLEISSGYVSTPVFVRPILGCAVFPRMG